MKNILFLGDSITDAGHAFDYEDLGEGYVRMIYHSLHFEDRKIKVLNRGTDGFTVKNVKRLWNLQHTKLRPDYITILVGINDIAAMKATGASLEDTLEQFKQTYDELLTLIRETYDGPILLMEPFIFPRPAEYLTWIEDVKAMGTVIQELAAKYEIEFLPVWGKLVNFAEANGYQKVTVDGVHLTKQGHQVLAETWLEHFKKLS